MARPRTARAAAPRVTRTAPGGVHRAAGRAPEVGADRRTRRPAGAEFAPRRLADGVRPLRLRRSGSRPRRAARGRPRPGRPRPRSLAPAAPLPAAAALRRHGVLSRPHRPRWPLHDVRLGLGAGVRGRRARGAGATGTRAPVVAGPPPGRGPAGRVRQLPAVRRAPHRLAVHPAAAVDADRRRAGGRSPAGQRPARHLGAARAGRPGDVRAPRRRPLGRAGGPDAAGVVPRAGAPAADPGGPRLPPHHALPAGQAARPPGAAHDRRAARGRRLDRAAGGDRRAVRRPRGHRDRLPGRQAPGGAHPGPARAAQSAVRGRGP